MGVRKGCYNCSQRRIICDRTEPRCLKCAKRGVECSGMGIRYRFNDGLASRGKLRGLSIPVIPAPGAGKDSKSPQGSHDKKDMAAACHSEHDDFHVTTGRDIPVLGDEAPSGRHYDQDGSDGNAEEIYPSLQHVPSQVALLLNYCMYLL